VIRKVGIWLRTSTVDQKLDSQSDAIEHYVRARGWEVVRRFEEHGISGAAQNRHVVEEILLAARRREFQAVLVFRGDRAFRSAGRGCLFIDELISSGCHFVSIDDSLDTSTPSGELMAKMITLLAEWERRAIRARVTAGIAAAKARGKRFGRPHQKVDLAKARKLMADGMGLKRTAKAVGVAAATLRRALRSTAGSTNPHRSVVGNQ
jgi:DNA invertase Pin-like site-specific DNA recombinase